MILQVPGYVTDVGGTWTQRWIFDGLALSRLRATIRQGTSIWFEVSAGGGSACVKLIPAA